MNSISYTPSFKRKVKPLVKKYRTLKNNIDQLANDLIQDPYLGESYGANIYKVRLADESKGKGKSGGFRIMYYLAIKKEDSVEILLVTIFDKSELDSITKRDAEKLIKQALDEIS